jgi:dihydroorotate dehydrogenase
MEPFSIGHVHFPNRILKSSGPGSFNKAECDRLFAQGYGGIICKTCTWQARDGNAEPNDIRLGGQRFNCYGLPNLGYAYYESLAQYYFLERPGTPFILSLSAHCPTELEMMVASYAKNGQVPRLLEINVSCPNTGGARIPGYHCSDMRKILDMLETYELGYGLKLPPYLEREKIAKMASLFVDYPCIRYVVCSNSVPNCLPIHEPLLSAVYGGMSGGANKYISMSNCRQFHELFKSAIPVIGCGGIATFRDIKEYLSKTVCCQAVQINMDMHDLINLTL